LRVLAGKIEDFPIYIKGQAFGLYLYILVVDVLVEYVQGMVPIIWKLHS